MTTRMKPQMPSASNASLCHDSIRKVKHFYQLAKVYSVTAHKQVLGVADSKEAPTTITWLTPEPHDSSKDQLFIDQHPIARENWKYNPQEETLSWHQGLGEHRHSGTLQMFAHNLSGMGSLSVGDTHFSATIDVKPVTYQCDVSANAGAYVTGKVGSLNLVWDTNSADWKNATWESKRFTFTYGLKGQMLVGQTNYVETAKFYDNQTETPWNPPENSFTLLVTPEFRFNFSAEAQETPTDPTSEDEIIKAVFPSLLSFDFDGFAANFAGAMLTGEETDLNPIGTVYAVKGSVQNPTLAGFYSFRTESHPTNILSVFNSRLHINHEPILTSWQEGNTIHWENLSQSQVSSSNLPESGSLHFSSCGSLMKTGSSVLSGQRISAEEALAHESIQHHPMLLMALNTTTSSGSDLDVHTLLNMSQYQKDKDGNWFDAIQQASMLDFYNILQAYMSSDLREQFISSNPPELDPQVKSISQVPGKNTPKPEIWYETLSIPYLVNALQPKPGESATDKYVATLNAVRAQAYLKNQTAISDVFQAQAPLLYTNRWKTSGGINGQIGDFIEDQEGNTEKYNQIIDQDVVQWKNEIDETVEPSGDNITNLKKMIDNIAEEGKKGKYWAYTFFRFATQPSALSLLRQISLSPATGLDGSAFTRRIQTNCAVLNILDTSSFFIQEYTQVIQLFQIGNILPTLIDYGGDINGYYFAVEKILQAFVDKYVDSQDPQMQEQAEKIQQALNERYITDVLDAYQQIASSFTGILNWEQLANKVEQAFTSRNYPKLAKVVGILGKNTVRLIVVSFGAAAIAGFVLGVKKWNDLNDDQKAQVVFGGVEVFSQLAAAIIKRGVAWYAVYDAENSVWTATKGIFTGSALTKASSRVENSFARWLVRSEGDDLALNRLAFAALAFSELEEEEITLAMRIFGRNLDEFVATRLGAMFAVVGIVFSSIALADSKDDLEIAGNALLLSSGILELFATGGAWALGSFGVEAIGGFAVASICAAATALAAFIAIVGVIILIIYLTRHQPSPIENFAKKEASHAGYYMPDKVAIDSFQIYQVEGQPQKSGVALEFNGQTSQSLQFHTDGSLTVVNQAYDTSTAFYLETDYRGYARFGSLLSGDNRNMAFFLTLDENKQLLGVAAITDKDKLDQQRWVAELIADFVLDGITLKTDIVWDGKFVQKASFVFYNAYWNAKGEKLYLSMSDGKATISGSPARWAVDMVSLTCAGLTMDNITLYTYMRDSKYLPSVHRLGSKPFTWSITPALPDFMDFDITTGQVSQKKGVEPTVFPLKEYTMTLSNALNTISATFSLEVKEFKP
ncbi:MAG: hypothetical protein RMY34_07870 [Aulosira sp. DedQUE10]|nr:hypothetical protein [Aulosira sp. DedQUE10]